LISSDAAVVADQLAIEEDECEIVDCQVEEVSVSGEEGLVKDDSLVVHCQFLMLEEVKFFLVFEGRFSQVLEE
jgi:hypothetical protein